MVYIYDAQQFHQGEGFLNVSTFWEGLWDAPNTLNLVFIYLVCTRGVLWALC